MKNYPIFVRIAKPSHHKKMTGSHWYTWSDDFRAFCIGLARNGSLDTAARLRSVEGCDPYSQTYYSSLRKLQAESKERLLGYCTSLADFECEERAAFFSKMLTYPFNGGRIKNIFSLLRSTLVNIYGDERSALYSPVNPEKDDTGFKLHSDLFISKKLLLVFDEIPKDGSGSTLLLSLADFLDIVNSFNSVPKNVKSKLSDLIVNQRTMDTFDEFYSLLYSNRSPWSEKLSLKMEKRAKSISFSSGEGYLINDRRWLHGRTRSTIPVTSNRFHRISFEIY